MIPVKLSFWYEERLYSALAEAILLCGAGFDSVQHLK